MSDIRVDISGIDDLQKTFDDLVKKYPDSAGDLLKKEGRSLRKEITNKAKSVVKTDSSNRYSLGKAGSYKISQIKGYGSNQFVEISAKSPHFHLVEHGHEEYDFKGNPTGRYVQGKHFLQEATKEFQGDMPKHVESMVDNLLKEGGLI